jgi:hypothetical protein
MPVLVHVAYVHTKRGTELEKPVGYLHYVGLHCIRKSSITIVAVFLSKLASEIYVPFLFHGCAAARRRYLYLTTHNTHKDTDIHAPDGIRTRNPSKEEAGERTPETARPLGSAFTFHTVVITKNADL